MSKSRIENKKKKMQEKKQTEIKEAKEKQTEEKVIEEKVIEEKVIEEKAAIEDTKGKDPIEEEEEEPLPLVKKLKYAMVILIALSVIFLGGFGYNAFNSRGHMFSGKFNSFDVLEDDCAVLNGRYTRLTVNAVEGWYAGGKIDENGNRIITDSGKCLVWLDSGYFISLNVEGEENVALINKMIETTKKYDNGEVDDYEDTVYFEGQLKKLSYEDTVAFREGFNKLMTEWNSNADLYKTYELTLDPNMTASLLHVTSIIYLSLGIVFAIVSIIVGIRYNKEKRVVNN